MTGRPLRTVPDLLATSVGSALVVGVASLETASNVLAEYAASESTPPVRPLRAALRDHDVGPQLQVVEQLVQRLRGQLDALAEGRKPAAPP